MEQIVEWYSHPTMKNIFIEKTYMKIYKGVNLIFVIFTFISIYACTPGAPEPDWDPSPPSEKIIPEPDSAKNNNTLLIIPASVEYPDKYFGGNNQKFTFQFIEKSTNKKFDFTITPKRGEKFIIIKNIKPGIYIFEKIKFPGDDGHESKSYVIGSSPRTKKDLDKSSRDNLNNLSIEIVNNKATIVNFKYAYWKEIYQGKCCGYYSIIEEINSEEIRKSINDLMSFENFDKWEITKLKTIIPEPDATKESQSLLVIPFSVDYPTNFGTPVKGWGIKFSSRINKTISFDPKFGQDYIVVEMEPGDYTGSKFIHPDYEGNDYIYGSYPRNRNDLEKSKRKNLRRLSFKLVNKNIKIADFRFIYWKQLGNDGGCCSYYGIIESIDDMVKNRTLDKISKLENFDKWKFTD